MPLPYQYCYYEAKLCLRKLILLLFFSECTPLHWFAREGHVEFCRLLVESKADVAARDRCFSPPPSHHLSLTYYLPCSASRTALKLAIEFDEADVAAYLRSIGAPYNKADVAAYLRSIGAPK